MGIGLFGGDEDEFIPPRDNWADGVCRPFSDDSDFSPRHDPNDITPDNFRIVHIEVNGEYTIVTYKRKSTPSSSSNQTLS